MIIPETKYGLDDLTLLPAIQSTIDSRNECNPFDPQGMLPLITSPMYSVIDGRNAHLFIKNGIYAIYPRGCNGEPFQNSFKAYGLDEFIEEFISKNKDLKEKAYVLIDIANGYMFKLSETIAKAKKRHGGNLIIMAGNIAHPETYACLSEAGADYVRAGIGGGSVCTTSANASVHYPMGSLIADCREIKEKEKQQAKIVADGGMRNFDDIIKALGLGADYVMCGSIFNKALESAGATKIKAFGPSGYMAVNQFDEQLKKEFKDGLEVFKEYYGMSTKRAQREMGHENLKTSEGITKQNCVEYTLGQWRENFIHYLKTAMSYTGKRNLADFIGEVDFGVITSAAASAYRK